MLLVFRCIFIFFYFFVVCLFGIFYCFFSPRQPKHVATFSCLFGYILNILGLKVKFRQTEELKKHSHAIYIANHQSYYDILTVSKILKSNVVTIGKRSLLWIPFFGILYWISGNFTINRNNSKKASNKIKKIIQIIKKKNFFMDIS